MNQNNVDIHCQKNNCQLTIEILPRFKLQDIFKIGLDISDLDLDLVVYIFVTSTLYLLPIFTIYQPINKVSTANILGLIFMPAFLFNIVRILFFINGYTKLELTNSHLKLKRKAHFFYHYQETNISVSPEIIIKPIKKHKLKKKSKAFFKQIDKKTNIKN